MRTVIGSLTALAAACLLTISSGAVAHAQRVCPGVDGDCAVSETPVPGVRIVRPENYPTRPVHYLSGDKYATLAEARETRNRFALVDLFVPPGGGPAPHTHTWEWEIFFVLQGTLNFYVGVDPRSPSGFAERQLTPGTAVYAPKCRVMGFQNRTGAPARALTFALPAGIDNFFHLTGDEVVHFDAPIPPATPEQTARLSFWGERENALPVIPGLTPLADCSGLPTHVFSSITGAGRPLETGPFGETRVVLVTPAEVGVTTGATAFCGAGPPNRPGGTVKYAYFSMPNQNNFPPPYISPFAEVVYVLTGTLTFRFGNSPVDVAAGTYVEIQPGVPFSVANFAGPGTAAPAQALSISVIAPPCQ